MNRARKSLVSNSDVLSQVMRRARDSRYKGKESLGPWGPDTGMYLANRIAAPNDQGCTEWLGTIGVGGYGRAYLKKIPKMAHRLHWEFVVGEIPKGLVLDHICRNRACVNIEHLRVVTQQQNALENSVGLAAINAVKTHCSKGHEFTEENTRMRRGRGTFFRACLICRRASDMRHYYAYKMPPGEGR